MNLLLVSMDSLRADHLGCYGHRLPTSPRLDAFAADGVRGEHCICPVVPTGPVHTTVFSGQHPLTHGVIAHGGDRSPHAGTPWLPSLLQRHGFTTCAVDNLRGIKPWFADGFEYYLDPSHRHGHTWSVPMSLLNERVLPWLRHHGAEQPWFLFVHCWDPHAPYHPPHALRPKFYRGEDPCDPDNRSLDRFRRQYFGDWFRFWIDPLGEDLGPGKRISDRAYLEAMYDAEIAHMDEHLGVLFDELEALGLADDTLVMLFGDHGEMMGENDVFFDHHSLYRGNTEVPLLCRWPAGGVTGGRTLPAMIQHTDFAPTLLEAAGVPIPDAMDGASFLSALRGEALAGPEAVLSCECTWQAGWSIRTATHKLIVARGRGLHNQPARELYDLVADPGETRNLWLDEWELGHRLEQQLADTIAARLREPVDPIHDGNITLGRRWWDWAAEHGPALGWVAPAAVP